MLPQSQRHLRAVLRKACYMDSSDAIMHSGAFPFIFRLLALRAKNENRQNSKYHLRSSIA